MMGKTDHDLLKALIADVKEIKSHLLGSTETKSATSNEKASHTEQSKVEDVQVDQKAVDLVEKVKDAGKTEQPKSKVKDITLDNIKDDKGAKK